MGRPAMKPEKKRQGLSVSLPAELLELAASTGNSSLFVLLDSWKAQFDEFIPFEKAFPKKAVK